MQNNVNAAQMPPWRLFRGYMGEPLVAALGIKGPPVDPIDIARRLGVHVHALSHDQPETFHGAVSSTEGRADIWVRPGDPANRQRFTVAHELGHLLLHPYGQMYRDTTFSGSASEAEANRFAADLLMPKGMMQKYLRITGGNLPSMARIFGVSLRAMEIRVDNLRRGRI